MIYGGPIRYDEEMQCDLEMDDRALSCFDLYEVGGVADKGTEIDTMWRRRTRPKRLRAKSEQPVAPKKEE